MRRIEMTNTLALPEMTERCDGRLWDEILIARHLCYQIELLIFITL